MLEPQRAYGVKHTYMTGPSSAPPSINDPPTSIMSAQANFDSLLSDPDNLAAKSAVLVCCFSNHPLVSMLRHQWPSIPSMHILDAAVNHAMSCGASTFGIITTGRAMVADIDAGVNAYLGGVSHRYKGCLATDLGVLELGDPSMRRHVEKRVRQESGKLGVQMGAEAIILGCAGKLPAFEVRLEGAVDSRLHHSLCCYPAGMAGMESLVKQGIVDAGGSPERVWVIDGAKAGVQLLAGMARCRYKDS